MAEFKYKITEEYEEYLDERLDKFLNFMLEDLSRTYIQKLLKEQLVFVNDKVEKANYQIREHDLISIQVPAAIEPNINPENIPLDVLYEDEDVIVVNKPKGMVVHPAPGHYSETLVNALMYHCRGQLSGINGVMRPGIVHRIDKDTTGSIIACKNDFSHNAIAEQLKEHQINRKYLAIVHGHLKEQEGTINAPIGRSSKDRKKMAVCPAGKPAITHYKVLQEFSDYSYIECTLETGRTHQIRVHMSSIQNPILGDLVYSARKADFNLHGYTFEGQTLHAYILGFKHPRTNEYIETIAPLPAYFNSLLSVL